jgi:hypothetical protein
MKELEKSELIEVEGGLLFLAAIPLAKVFIWGVATGLAIGVVVLDHILDKQ